MDQVVEMLTPSNPSGQQWNIRNFTSYIHTSIQARDMIGLVTDKRHKATAPVDDDTITVSVAIAIMGVLIVLGLLIGVVFYCAYCCSCPSRRRKPVDPEQGQELDDLPRRQSTADTLLPRRAMPMQSILKNRARPNTTV
ncbi:hypothetical protein PFICI_04720 [Pestalotiopsis fici W106-1]|uniref:Uncharacterized protein n=1 Tax=Pestalotiopsis fici (strain W106-1 / CGMCC3.15140) TaxID=1229662 RepID=W3X9Z3_PESFW|nr:uncharacterized protein PFICI_04720 [Pestalotiopsis fici W106-1]ETS82844.1 hypothetical protein PFICI_04720 [Pestalotiopsis fici W106-1]